MRLRDSSLTVEPFLMLNTKYEQVVRKVIYQPFALLILLTVTGLSTVSADVLSELSDADRDYIERICLPVQYKEGARAYRECVFAQISELPSATELARSELTFDEQYAIQQMCTKVGVAESEDYQACTRQQIRELSSVAAPDFSQLTDDEIYAVQQSCFAVQTNDGATAYRECLNSSLVSLQTLPRPDLSALTLVERNALQLRCSAGNGGAATYRGCLLDATDQLPSESTTLDASLAVVESPIPDAPLAAVESPITDAPLAAVENPITDASLVAVESPVLDEPLVVESPIEEGTRTDIVTSTPIEQTSEPTTASSLTEFTSEIDTEPSELLALAADTPLAENNAPAAEAPLLDTSVPASADGNSAGPSLSPQVDVERNPSTMSNAPAALENQPITEDSTRELTEPALGEKASDIGIGIWNQLSSSISSAVGINQVVLFAAMGLPLLLIVYWGLMRKQDKQREQFNQSFPKHQPRGRSYPDPDFNESRQSRDDTAAIDPVQNRFSSQADTLFAGQVSNSANDDDSEEIERVQAAAATDFNAASRRRQLEHAGFQAWLSEQPLEARLSYAIEFLVYWMAYGDERYEPELKKKIFTLQDPSDHDLIKRWVLKQDVRAFKETVQWLQKNSSPEQREQVLGLLMALLVNENALTPVQNTLLRFWTDAFGLAPQALDTLYTTFYEQELPPLPRTDKPLWWDEQAMDHLKRWDARSVSKQTQDIQCRVKLGLPLTGEIEQQDLLQHFQRAADRCHPRHYDQLTSRERLLVERQVGKFEVARDVLMEISV